jgi:hypothetical protein
MTINFSSGVVVSQGATPVVALQSDQFGLVKNQKAAFAAYNGNAAGGGSVVTWSVVEFDLRNNFTPANGRFTASIAGTYFFKYHQLMNYATAGEYRVNIRVNGAGQWGRSIFYKIQSSAYATLQIEARITLNVGDYVDVYIESAAAVMATDSTWSFFQGYRI